MKIGNLNFRTAKWPWAAVSYQMYWKDELVIEMTYQYGWYKRLPKVIFFRIK